MGTVSKTLDKRPIHTPYITTYDRVKTANGFKESSAYLKRYYSMIDAEIYFGDFYVEDIIDLDWALVQNTQPLYGYNSYIYDEVAQGSRHVSGKFSIAFSSPNYLNKILEQAKEDPITTMSSYVIPAHERVTDHIEGAINKNLEGEIDNPKHNCIWPQTFDIDIIYGQKTGVGDPVHVVLQGVKLVGVQSSVSGESSRAPQIEEIYTFVAQDIKTIA